MERQLRVAELIREKGLHRGTQVRLAQALGVSPSTITRDIRAIFGRDDQLKCPACGCAVSLSDVTWSWRPHRPAGAPPLRLVYDADDDV